MLAEAGKQLSLLNNSVGFAGITVATPLDHGDELRDDRR